MKQPSFSIRKSELRTTLQETTSIVKSIFETANYPGTRSRFFELKSTERNKAHSLQRETEIKFKKDLRQPFPKTNIPPRKGQNDAISGNLTTGQVSAELHGYAILITFALHVPLRSCLHLIITRSSL